MKYICSILFLAVCFSATSQDIDRQKVGWVYLLANFIEWPGNPDEYTIQVITEDRSLTAAFREMEAKRQINEKPIKVSFSSYVSIPERLDIIYVSGDYNNSLQNILGGIRGKNVLIFTEQSPDQQYVMINLVDTPEGMSFEYNVANMTNQGLRIKPDFSELGGNEIDVAALYQQVRDSVRIMEQRSLAVKERIDTLDVLSALAFKVGNDLIDQVDERQARLYRQKEMLDSLNSKLRNRELQLLGVVNEISMREDSIRYGEDRLLDQEAQISQGDRAISDKEAELRVLNVIIENQLEILVFLIVFALLFILALFLSYKAYTAKRRDAKKLNEQKEELDELLETLRVTQKQLIHAEKLAAVGALSESIAHEVNNAMNYVHSGIHVIDKKFAETKAMMTNVKALDVEDSNLKTKVKVRDIVNQKEEMDYDSYESVIDRMMNSILVGADRISNVLKDLKPYMSYAEMGKFGLALLGKLDDSGSDYTLPRKALKNGKRKQKRISRPKMN